MTATTFNVAKGAVAAYARLPLTNDGIVAVLLKAAGLEAASVLQDYDNLSVLLAGTNDECDFAGYARKAVTGNTATVDDTNNWTDVDCADISFTITASQGVGLVVICYDPDVGTGTDADLIPLVMDDIVATTPPLGTLIYQVAAGGYFRAA